MQDIGKIILTLVIVFLILTLVFNIKPKLAKVPGDLYIDKFGFKIYVPWLSSIIISVIFTLTFNYFRK